MKSLWSCISFSLSFFLPLSLFDGVCVHAHIGLHILALAMLLSEKVEVELVFEVTKSFIRIITLKNKVSW